MEENLPKKWNFNLSYSAYKMYCDSQLLFFFAKILKLKPQNETPDSYGAAGTVVHSVQDAYIEDRSIDTVALLNKLWDESKVSLMKTLTPRPLDKNDYLLYSKYGIEFVRDNIIEGNFEVEREFNFCKKEYDFLNMRGFIDLEVTMPNGDIYHYDWKTDSTASKKKHETQRLFYAWATWVTKGVVPKKSIWVYMHKKVVGKKGKAVTHSNEFTLFDVKKFDAVIRTFINDIKMKGKDIKKYDIGETRTPFNNYKQLCINEKQERQFADTKNVIGGMIQNNLIYFTHGLPTDLHKFSDKFFSYMVDNAHFIPAVKEGKWNGIIHMFKREKNGFLTLPFAYVNKLKDIILLWNKKKGTSYELNLTDMRHEQILDIKYNTKFKKSPFVLRPYQKEAVDIALDKKFLTLKLPPSSGKTLISSEIIKRVNKRTLFVCNRLELIKQTVETYEQHLGLEVGVMTEGELCVDKQFTVSGIQTLYAILKREDVSSKQLRNYLANVNVVVMDESHGVSDSSWWSMLQSTLRNVEYCVGLSATPFRNDAASLTMQSVVGFVEYEQTKKDLELLGFLCPTKSLFVKMTQPLDALESDDYQDNYNQFIVYHDERNNYILDFIKRHPHKKVMVVVTKLLHGEILNGLIPNSFFLNGSTPKKKRVSKMQEFKDSDDSFVMISMSSIVGTGLSIDKLDVLINASANRSRSLTIQMQGRTARLHDGKTMGYFVTFLDNGLFANAAREQLKILKEFDADIDIMTDGEILK